MDNDLCNDDDTSIKIQTIWQLIEIDAEEKKKIHSGKNINKCNQL